MQRCILLPAFALLGAATVLQAQTPAPGERISFVSCPVLRDTRTVPCWLSEYAGTLYYLTIQSDVTAPVTPPMLGHKVLVEGIVSDDPAICGGVPLHELRLSVMPELDANCNTLLPAQEDYVIDFHPRPPGPSGGRLAFAPDNAEEQGEPELPSGPRTFELYFDFDKGVSFRHPNDLQAIVETAQQIDARHMRVTGSRGAHLLTDGTLLFESESIGQRRAEEITRLLQGAGITAETETSWVDAREDADGLDDWQSRQVRVELLPGTPTVAYTDAALPTHTLYRPRALHGTYPVVLWGNGSCVNSNYQYREFLTEIASHGFIVVANGPHRDGPAPRQTRSDDPAEWPPFETDAQLLLDGLDWITVQHGSVDSDFHGHVQTDKVAVMGHSCGGLQAIKVSTDPRIGTTLVLNSGLLADDDPYMARHGVQRSILGELNAPIAYFIGGESDIAWPNAENDWRDLRQLQITAISVSMDVGHGATYDEPDGGVFATAPLAWLQWHLQDSDDARASFVGEDCRLCIDPDWRLRTHRLEAVAE